jgi:hypothetical protein
MIGHGLGCVEAMTFLTDPDAPNSSLESAPRHFTEPTDLPPKSLRKLDYFSPNLASSPQIHHGLLIVSRHKSDVPKDTALAIRKGKIAKGKLELNKTRRSINPDSTKFFTKYPTYLRTPVIRSILDSWKKTKASPLLSNPDDGDNDEISSSPLKPLNSNERLAILRGLIK